MYNTETLAALFETLRLFVLAAGGDGDGYLVSENYREYADLFERYEQQFAGFFVERTELENFVTFSSGPQGQEAVIFCATLKQLPQVGGVDYIGDIVIRIH